jgi:hypothetical protein
MTGANKWRGFVHNSGQRVPRDQEFANYVHHLFAKHAGEVVMVSRQGSVCLSQREWPTSFFHPQFAIKAADRAWLHQNHKSAAGDKTTAAQAAAIGSTTLLEFSEDGESATFTVAKVMSLPELFVWGPKGLPPLSCTSTTTIA